MVNASWDIIIVVLIVSSLVHEILRDFYNNKMQAVYWVETKGKTLEEIDAIFEGEKHSSVPDVELVRTGQEKLDVGLVEEELTKEVVILKSQAET